MSDKKAPSTHETGAATSTTFIERLAEKVSRAASSTTVYGTPVERDGVTVVPVAKLRYGFGGGSGRKHSDEEGSGGGGGVYARPVGYIEIKDDSSQYRPIRDPAAMVPVIAVGGLVGIVALRILARMFRR
jgi:uncharacterized spore protein YtfJ